jgi:hypothetical protein
MLSPEASRRNLKKAKIYWGTPRDPGAVSKRSASFET